MLKPSAQTDGSSTLGTKGRIVQAALETLKANGFSGATARAIAGRGGFNQALIFYHFRTLDALLLEALDQTSRERMTAYTGLLDQVGSIEDLLSAAVQIYREDLDSGHITVLSELIAGSLSHPKLGPEVVARMEPWIDFAEKAIDKVTGDAPIAQLLAKRELAFAVVAFYLGIEMLNHLEGNRARTESLFETASRFSPLITSIIGGHE